jgi:hypothetical protein
MMLILLMAFVFAAPLIHTHYNEASVELAEKEIIPEIKKCPVCTFLAHYQQEKYLISLDQPSMAGVRTVTVKLPEVFVGTYIYTLQGLTNKGPPLS